MGRSAAGSRQHAEHELDSARVPEPEARRPRPRRRAGNRSAFRGGDAGASQLLVLRSESHLPPWPTNGRLNWAYCPSPCHEQLDRGRRDDLSNVTFRGRKREGMKSKLSLTLDSQRLPRGDHDLERRRHHQRRPPPWPRSQAPVSRSSMVSADGSETTTASTPRAATSSSWPATLEGPSSSSGPNHEPPRTALPHNQGGPARGRVDRRLS
jgi:hypothetical protein